MNFERWKSKARELKRETRALYLCSRHPRTPLYAKLFAILIVAYAMSPIDLIPDFVPVLGYLDDLILIPAGIALLIRMVPHDVLAECRRRAGEKVPARTGWIGGVFVVCLWFVALYITIRFLGRFL